MNKKDKKIIVDELNKILEKYPPRTKTKHEQIFFNKIVEYNETREMYTHYIKINNDVMVIEFYHSWRFGVYPLEEI